jgi:hypothetical protein
MKHAESKPRVSASELRRAAAVFEAREGRDSMYRVATFLLTQWWGRYREMSDALSVLLLTWNGAFYRYGPFDQRKLESCLERHWPSIEAFRARDILSTVIHKYDVIFYDGVSRGPCHRGRWRYHRLCPG